MGVSCVDSPTVFRVFKLPDQLPEYDLFAHLLLIRRTDSEFIISANVRSRFDKIFKACKLIDTYGPHGFRSGLSLSLMILGYSDQELMKYFYWNSSESLQRYTYGIELSNLTRFKDQYLKQRGIDFTGYSIYETVGYLVKHHAVFVEFFEKLRMIVYSNLEIYFQQ